VVDEETFKKMGLDCEHLYLLVHSGSRAFGEAIYQFFVDTYGTKGFFSYNTTFI
jgi:RNA-splicing ligase RtcB